MGANEIVKHEFTRLLKLLESLTKMSVLNAIKLTVC